MAELTMVYGRYNELDNYGEHNYNFTFGFMVGK